MAESVSIIVPARDEEATVAEVVRSALIGAPSAEVVVVDDGSSDRTEAEAEAAGARVIPSLGRGKGAALWTGVRQTTGEVVVFLDGDVTNPSFVGSGTLVANGKISGVSSFGTATLPVNLVANGDITTNSGTFYGTLYASGAWYRQKINLTGMVYVNGISPANPGASSMVMTSPAWFDPRVDPSGRILTKFTDCAGVQP